MPSILICSPAYRCELVVRELKRIQTEELQNRRSLEMQGVQDPADQGVPLPRFRLGLIERDTEEYDERVRAEFVRLASSGAHGLAEHQSNLYIICTVVS